MNFFKGNIAGFDDSIFIKLLFLPFTLIGVIQKKFGEKLNKTVQQSALCEAGRVYVQNFMALNTRFWGAMLLAASVVFNTFHFVSGRGINKYVLILSVVSALMLIVNYNVTRFFSSSRVVSFCKMCAGLSKVEFDF